jgi:predicted acetyltransferase
MALTFGPVGPDSLDEADALLGPALHFPGGTMRGFITDMVGLEHMRAVRRDGRIVAGLGAIPFGQWFGGRPVPCAGITAVGVAPDVRGAGVGAFMLRENLAELRAAGVPLACLFPATLSFYRGAGYERAGQRITYELPLGQIEVRGAEPIDLTPFGPESYAEVRALYDARAARTNGHLARPDWLWATRLTHQERQPFRFIARRGGRAEGYISYTVGGRSDPILVADVVALTPAAGRRFLELLADYRSVIEHAVWGGGAADPLVQLLAENLVAGTRQRVGIRTSYDWMLRIVDVERALTARGYRRGVSASVELELHDSALPENAGRYTLEVAGGQAQVRRGGSGRVQLGARELAALYAGFLAPEELRAIGAIAGPDEDMDLLGAIFSGPKPWMSDIF